jgi:hypothetical protein
LHNERERERENERGIVKNETYRSVEKEKKKNIQGGRRGKDDVEPSAKTLTTSWWLMAAQWRSLT